MRILKIMPLLGLLVILLPATIIAQNQTKGSWNPVYYSKNQSTNIDLEKVKADLKYLLNEKNVITINGDNPNKFYYNKSVMVMDDRIEVQIKRENVVVNFSDMMYYNFFIQEYTYTDPSLHHPNPYSLSIGDLVWFYFPKSQFEKAKKVANDFNSIKSQLRSALFESKLATFKPLAEEYLALKVKPPVSEEQRKYIVQANAFIEQKQYSKAIEIYQKALILDKTAYPSGYWNIALQYANLKQYDAAIYYMKKYLMLAPEAADARNGQDKIYEWEALGGITN